MALSGTLTKGHIIDLVAERNGFTILLELIKQSLESGDDVLISGFGKFCVKKKRRGRNPATGTDIMLKPRKVVTFQCSGKLREKINDN